RLTEEIAALIASVGISTAGLRIEPCDSGGNNRVYRVDVGTHTMAAKRYFRHPSDTRDRMNAEYMFLQYARKAGITCVPNVVARNDDNGVALYEFVEGRKPRLEEIDAGYVEQARDFFLQLNDSTARALGMV